MARGTTRVYSKGKRGVMNLLLVGFDRESVNQIQSGVHRGRFRLRKHADINPDAVGASKDSLLVVEMKRPTLLDLSLEKVNNGTQLRGWRRQLRGFSPIVVTPWLNPSRTTDQLVAHLLEEDLGATLFWGKAYKHSLVSYLLDYCQKDPSRVLTNVTVTDTSVGVTFGDGKQASLVLTEFRRLVESNNISWDSISIARSRDYLQVGLLTGRDVPVPGDVLREFVKEEQNRRRTENQRLAKETSSQLGRQTRFHREEKQMTQEELAKRANVSRWTIIRLENGKFLPRVSALQRIAQALGLSLGSFLSSET